MVLLKNNGSNIAVTAQKTVKVREYIPFGGNVIVIVCNSPWYKSLGIS